MGTMTIDTRRRIAITDTPQVSALIARHRHPGEAKAATLLRLAEQNQNSEVPPSHLMVFNADRLISSQEVAAALDADDTVLAHGGL